MISSAGWNTTDPRWRVHAKAILKSKTEKELAKTIDAFFVWRESLHPQSRMIAFVSLLDDRDGRMSEDKYAFQYTGLMLDSRFAQAFYDYLRQARFDGGKRNRKNNLDLLNSACSIEARVCRVLGDDRMRFHCAQMCAVAEVDLFVRMLRFSRDFAQSSIGKSVYMALSFFAMDQVKLKEYCESVMLTDVLPVIVCDQEHLSKDDGRHILILILSFQMAFSGETYIECGLADVFAELVLKYLSHHHVLNLKHSVLTSTTETDVEIKVMDDATTWRLVDQSIAFVILERKNLVKGERFVRFTRETTARLARALTLIISRRPKPEGAHGALDPPFSSAKACRTLLRCLAYSLSMTGENAKGADWSTCTDSLALFPTRTIERLALFLLQQQGEESSDYKENVDSESTYWLNKTDCMSGMMALLVYMYARPGMSDTTYQAFEQIMNQLIKFVYSVSLSKNPDEPDSELEFSTARRILSEWNIDLDEEKGNIMKAFIDEISEFEPLVHASRSFRAKEACCTWCGTSPEDPMACTGCMQVVYCDKACQLKDWKRNHKFECDKKSSSSSTGPSSTCQ